LVGLSHEEASRLERNYTTIIQHALQDALRCRSGNMTISERENKKFEEGILSKVHMFTATTRTQGQRENDFCFVPEGEIVTFLVLTCTNEEPDGQCGCRRAMAGAYSRKATTTMKVEVRDREELEQAILASCREGGWSKAWNAQQEDAYVKETTQRIIDEAYQFQVGTVVELRGNDFAARSSVAC
jgi:hypothetical protein